MRWWLFVALLLVMTSALTQSLRALGAGGDSPQRIAILLPDERCGIPCWNGIRPSVTTGAQAETIFRQLPNSREIGEGLWAYAPKSGYQNMVAYREMLTLTADRMPIGAVMIHIGPPAYQTRQLAVRIATNETQQLVRLYYPDLHMILVAAVPVGGRLSPQSPIAAINFVGGPLPKDAHAISWFGFAWMDRYPTHFDS